MAAMFDRTLILNLDSRPDRWSEIQSRLPADWLPTPERFAAIEGQRQKIPTDWRTTPGAYGCYLSHLLALSDAVTRQERVLILEDDCLFCDNFTQRADAFLTGVPGDWDQVYLGGQHDKPPVAVATGIERTMGTRRTHAYGVSPEGAAKLLDLLSQAKIKNHIDLMFSAVHPKIQAYCPTAWLCGQAAGTSDILGIVPRARTIESWWQYPREESHAR